MAQASGANKQILLLPESTWGTMPSVTPGDSFLIPFEDEGLDVSQGRDQNPHISNSRNYGSGALGQMDGGGSLSMKLNPLSHVKIIEALLGSLVTTGASTPYTHTIKIGSTLPSFTIEKGFTDNDDYFLLNGCTCGSASFTVNPSGFLDLSTTWMAAGEDDTSPTTSTFDSAPTDNGDSPLEMTDANMVLTEGGSTIATVTALSFTVDNQLDGSVYAVGGAGRRAGITPGKCRVSGTLEAIFEDTTLYAKATGSTESSITIAMQHGTGAGTAGNENMTIYIPEIKYGRAIPKGNGPNGQKYQLPFEAYYENDSGASSIYFVFENAIASY